MRWTRYRTRRRFERSRRWRGDDHPTTAQHRATLISELEERHDSAALLPLWEAELVSQRRIGGPESLAAFNAGIALGDTLRDLGRYEAARQCAEELVESTSAVAGEYAAATMTAKTLLALTLDCLQAADELRALCEDLLPRATELFGHGDRRTLNIRGCYATALRRTGDLDAAIATGLEVLRDCRRFLGNDDLRTVVSLSNVARAFEDSRAYEAAESLRREALQRYQTMFPHGNARVWYAQLDLAHLRLLMGHPDEALELQESVLASVDLRGDPTGLVRHEALAGAVSSHEALGQVDGAAEAMSRHIDLHVARDGADDPTVVRMRSDLAVFLASAIPADAASDVDGS
jgi:hypothetical protein